VIKVNFTITVDTGNIEKDIITTINNYSTEEMSKFINAIKLYKDNYTIKGKPIFFRYSDCEQIISSIRDFTKVPLEIRKKIKERTRRIDTEQIFLGLSNEKSIKNEFLRTLIETFGDKIDTKQKFCDALSNDKYDSQFYNQCLKIISSDEYFNKFLDYDNNINIFNRKYTQEEYVLELSKILGYQEHDIHKDNPVYKYQFINFNMLLRYLKLRKIINVDIKMLG